MGLRIILEIHQAENLVFSDLALMNSFLMKQGMGELYSDLEGIDDGYFDGPFELDGVDLRVACREDGFFEGYDSYTSIYGCFGEREMRTIARFLIGGKIVFHIDIEGNPDEYWVITPGNVEQKTVSF
jgi:hypothetical protein